MSGRAVAAVIAAMAMLSTDASLGNETASASQIPGVSGLKLRCWRQFDSRTGRGVSTSYFHPMTSTGMSFEKHHTDSVTGDSVPDEFVKVQKIENCE
jgi:hypothetical protein